jgi:hypothetical protein
MRSTTDTIAGASLCLCFGLLLVLLCLPGVGGRSCNFLELGIVVVFYLESACLDLTFSVSSFLIVPALGELGNVKNWLVSFK